MWKTPLEIPLVLMAVRNERMGGSGGASYVTKASITARNKAKKFIDQHFTIVEKSPAEVGWKLGENTHLKI